MTPVEYLERCGGVANAADLSSTCGRAAVRTAVRHGAVVRDGRGRYALPHADAALRAARAISGVVSCLSAARWWGWETKVQPRLPSVTVPQHRKRRPAYDAGVAVSYRDLPDDRIVEPGVTTAIRTVLDCATALPFDEALAVADSALRHEDVTPQELLAAVDGSPNRGKARRRRVVLAADPRADNPFESVLRAMALDAGLDVVPQVPIYIPHRWVRPDLLDERRGIALEAESFTWHGERSQLMTDCHKYDELTMLGLTVLRFGWEQVVLQQQWARDVLVRVSGTGVAAWRSAAGTHPRG
ncbi:MAG: hypothetical protein ACR2FG_06660 [Marmoricola sp.]